MLGLQQFLHKVPQFNWCMFEGLSAFSVSSVAEKLLFWVEIMWPTWPLKMIPLLTFTVKCVFFVNLHCEAPFVSFTAFGWNWAESVPLYTSEFSLTLPSAFPLGLRLRVTFGMNSRPFFWNNEGIDHRQHWNCWEVNCPITVNLWKRRS